MTLKTTFFKLDGSQQMTSSECWACNQTFKLGDQVICQAHRGFKQYYHAKCFNWKRD